MVRDNGYHDFNRRQFLKTTGVLGLTATAGIAATSGSASAQVEVEDPGQWTEEHASQITRQSGNTAPLIEDDPVQIVDDWWVWDTWPLRNRDGSITVIDGWQIIFSLVADTTRPEIEVPVDRHNFARIGYFYSQNGQSGGEEGWQFGGEVFDPESFLGNQTWAGSAMYDQEREEIFHFYTAAKGLPGTSALPEGETHTQRPALAKGSTIETSAEGVEISQPESHHILAEPDGEMYETSEQSSGILYAFRDPWYFQHPETGEDWMVFEGNTPTESDDPQSPQNFNGNIGAARATNEELTEWELFPPILEAVGVSQQLERPHIIFSDDGWYIFFITHEFTYSKHLWEEGEGEEKVAPGPEALHGFLSDGLYDSDMQPLNGSSLVVANPVESPFQSYSWLAMPMGGNAVVESFVNFRDVKTLDLPGEELRNAFGGTLAPSLRVQLNGQNTQVVEELADGAFPAEIGRGGGQQQDEETETTQNEETETTQN